MGTDRNSARDESCGSDQAVQRRPIGIIYGLTGPDGIVRYVGCTTGPLAVRLQGHRSRAFRPRLPVHVWMRDVGRENITAVVLEETSDIDRILAVESSHIQSRLAAGEPLLNAHPGRPRDELSRENQRRIERAQAAAADAQTELEAAVLDAYRDGASLRSITERTGIAGSTVVRWAKEKPAE